MTKVFTIATMPQDLAQKWLQHLRDFDQAHPECHFEVMVDAPPGVNIVDAVLALHVEPELSFTAIFGRKKKGP
jgi:hypothetical protein